MNSLKLIKQFLKSTKVWIIGLLISMLTIQLVLSSIELNHIEEYIIDTSKKNAETLSNAINELDVFSVRKVLWLIYDGRTNYLSFHSSFLANNHFQNIELGILNSSLFQRIVHHDIIFSGLNIGQLTYSVDYYNLQFRVFKTNLNLYLFLLAIFFIILFSSSFSVYMAIHALESSINSIADLKTIDDLEKRQLVISGSYNRWLFSFQSDGVTRLFEKMNGLLMNERKSIQNQTMSEVAKQVSHDIRSPLSALNMIISSLKNIPEEQRIMLRSATNRINDIANQLLSKNHQSKNNESINNSNQEFTVELLPAIIDVIVSEKRVQFREKSNLTIESDLESSYGAFAKLNSTEFKRVISNLINNAVEALNLPDGKITVAVKKYDNKVRVSILDNGSGIPKHILEKLGQIGVTHGKEGTESGSGLGVYHAKKTIESFGAQFQILSEEDIGTEIRMDFPICDTPKWFVPKLEIIPSQIIIALDDDQSILEIWKQRFKQFEKVKLITFTSDIDFIHWNETEANLANNAIFLMDFELLGQKHTGLDLIEKLNLSNNAILVTSRYEEPKLRERCDKLNVRQIPKAMASLVPIHIIKEKIKYDVILIDDDSLITMTWEFGARENGKTILCFHSENEFMTKMHDIDFNSPIFIDVNLSHGVRGQDVATRIYEQGFKNISLATGYESSSVDRPLFIKNVIGKDFPF